MQQDAPQDLKAEHSSSTVFAERQGSSRCMPATPEASASAADVHWMERRLPGARKWLQRKNRQSLC